MQNFEWSAYIVQWKQPIDFFLFFSKKAFIWRFILKLDISMNHLQTYVFSFKPRLDFWASHECFLGHRLIKKAQTI